MALFEMEIEKPKEEPTITNEDNENLKLFLNGIKSVEKIKRASASDVAKWRFTMHFRRKTEVIEIDNDKLMNGPAKFNSQFKSAFGIFLPRALTQRPKKGEKNQWEDFQLKIESICTEVEPENDDTWLEIDRVLSYMSKIQYSTDDNEYESMMECGDTYMYKTNKDGEDYYCITSDIIAKIKSTIFVKLSLQTISTTLRDRGFKLNENYRVDLPNSRPRHWWIKASVIDEFGKPEKRETEDRDFVYDERAFHRSSIVSGL